MQEPLGPWKGPGRRLRLDPSLETRGSRYGYFSTASSMAVLSFPIFVRTLRVCSSGVRGLRARGLLGHLGYAAEDEQGDAANLEPEPAADKGVPDLVEHDGGQETQGSGDAHDPIRRRGQTFMIVGEQALGEGPGNQQAEHPRPPIRAFIHPAPTTPRNVPPGRGAGGRDSAGRVRLRDRLREEEGAVRTADLEFPGHPAHAGGHGDADRGGQGACLFFGQDG